MSSTVTLTKLQARLSQPLAQRADLAAAHPPPLKLPLLVGNAYVLYGNAYQAACPALTALWAQSADQAAAHPPPLKLAFLYGNAFLQQISTAARFFMRKLRLPIKLAHICSAPFLGRFATQNQLKKSAPQKRAAAVNICCKFLYGNACVLYGNAHHAARPALTSYGAESRPSSSPPAALKLAFLYGNAFLQQILTAARFLCASFAPLCKNPLGYANGILLRSAKHAHERLNTSSPLHFLGRFCFAKTYLRNTLRRYVQ